MFKVTRKNLAQELSEKTNLSARDSDLVIGIIFDLIVDHLSKKTPVNIVGFGKFETRQRIARNGRNPKTGESMHISGVSMAAFKAGSYLKGRVRGTR